MMLWNVISKLKCFLHRVVGRSKQEARQISPKTRIQHFLSLILTCQLSEQCRYSSADHSHIVHYIKWFFHGSSYFLCLFFFLFRVCHSICQGALSGQEEVMHIYTQTHLGKDFRANHKP